MEQQPQFENQGGDIEKSLNGEVRLDLKRIAKEAWQLSKTRKEPYIQGILLLFFVALIFASIIQGMLGVSDLQALPADTVMMLKLVGVVVTTPIIASIFLVGISHSVGVKPQFFTVLKQVIGSLLVILLALLLAAIADLGSILGAQVNVIVSTLVLLYINLATGFAIMLLVEKKWRPSQCVIQSIKVFNRYWLPLTLFYIFYYISLFLGIFTFGFAYIWIVPFFINMKGILYRELFGIKVRADKHKTQSKEAVFHA
ncbi:hypothetical protein [Paraglaciecola aestuariivivens]